MASERLYRPRLPKVVLDVLAPRGGPLPPLAAFASADADRAADLFLEHGGLLRPRAVESLSSADLHRHALSLSYDRINV